MCILHVLLALLSLGLINVRLSTVMQYFSNELQYTAMTMQQKYKSLSERNVNDHSFINYFNALFKTALLSYTSSSYSQLKGEQLDFNSLFPDMIILEILKLKVGIRSQGWDHLGQADQIFTFVARGADGQNIGQA